MYLYDSIWGVVKTPSPFKWFFQTLSFFFPLIVFPSAGFTPWSKNSHERGKGKGKGIAKEGKGQNRKGRGKGKGKEKERKRKGKGKKKRKEKERKPKSKGKRKGKRTAKRKEGKGRVKEETGKGKERERKRKKQCSVSHGPFLMPKVIVFVIVRESSPVCVPFFSGNGCNHQKRSVATTYSTRHLPCAESAPLRQQTMKGKDQKH